MLQKACPICKVVGVIAIISALNSGLVGLIHTNYVDRILSHVHLARVFDVLSCLAAVALLVSFFTCCPKCKK